eukprot:6081149-Prymnesium_polylepis.1
MCSSAEVCDQFPHDTNYELPLSGYMVSVNPSTSHFLFRAHVAVGISWPALMPRPRPEVLPPKPSQKIGHVPVQVPPFLADQHPKKWIPDARDAPIRQPKG